MARGRKKAAALETQDTRLLKSIVEAVDSFLTHCKSNGVQDSSWRKYRATMEILKAFCKQAELETVAEMDVDFLDAFRASRSLAPITAVSELRLLRQFFTYCFDRRWVETNPAKAIKLPSGLKPTDKEPYTPSEMAAIIAACDRIGHSAYERLRSRAMVLLLRYTALRIGDVALLACNRISSDGKTWRIFLRTEKSGKPIFLPIPQELRDALEAVPKRSETHFFWGGVNSERTMKGIAQRVMRSVFRRSKVELAHAHRFRHTLATELLVKGATFEEVADILGNTPDVVRRHYAKWCVGRQTRIDELMARVHDTAEYTVPRPQLVN
jgi:site-specific recombinase XerD